jgi:hypothetical protein
VDTYLGQPNRQRKTNDLLIYQNRPIPKRAKIASYEREYRQ